MKRIIFLLVTITCFFSCQRVSSIKEGEYRIMSYSLQEQAIKDSIPINSISMPVIHFIDNKHVKIVPDLLDTFHDSVFTYTLRNECIVLKGEKSSHKFEYRYDDSYESRVTLTLNVNSRYVSQLDFVSFKDQK